MLVCCASFLRQCLAVMIATFACFWTLPLITSRWLSFIASAVLSLGRSRTIAKHSGFRGFFVGLLIMLGRGGSLSLQELCFQYVEAALLPNTLVSEGFLWVCSSCWEEVALFHCKSCAFSTSKPHYCQTHWFQRVFCGFAHHVGKRWLSFIARAVLSVRPSRTIAKHTGFRGFLWVGSSCWEEVTLFHCKNCAFIRLKPHYCQTHWFQRIFVGWLIMLGRGGSLSLQELCFQ